jgi:chromate transporter
LLFLPLKLEILDAWMFVKWHSSAYCKKIAQNISIKAFIDGITASVAGALVGAVVLKELKNIVDIPAIIIALLTVALLILFQKVKEPAIIFGRTIIVLILKTGIL